MISLPRFRELLGDAGKELTANEIEALKEQLYALANSVCELYRNGDRISGTEQEVLSQLPPGTLDEVEERAAMLEFDAKMTRDQATRMALGICLASERKRTRPS